MEIKRKKNPISSWFSHLKPSTRDNIVGYGFLLPNLIGCMLFTFLPVLFSLLISFTNWDYTKGLGNWNFVGILERRVVYKLPDQYAGLYDCCCANYHLPCFDYQRSY